MGDIPTDFEELEQVVELAMDVAADGDGWIHPLYIALLHQDLLGFGAQILYFLFCDRLPFP